MIIGGMATIPSRASTLKWVIDSIVPQVDTLIVAFNGYKEEQLPEWLLEGDYDKVVIIQDEHNTHGDAAKFFLADYFKDSYYCTFDDDLIVNYRHVERLINGVDKYGGACGYHGRIYPRPVESFFKHKINYRCLYTVKENVKVDLLGTGCACFHTDKLKITLDMFKERNMADCFFARACADQSVPMYVLSHGKSFFTYLPQEKTIWRSNTQESVRLQTEILRSFLK
jgi:hypothetical protein